MVIGAKCRICQSVLKPGGKDLVSCNCGEISIDYLTGELHANIQKDRSNLILIDDEGNEIVPRTTPPETPLGEVREAVANAFTTKPDKQELLDMLDHMRKNIEDLPMHAALAPVTHADFCSLLLLLSSILRSD